MYSSIIVFNYESVDITAVKYKVKTALFKIYLFLVQYKTKVKN